MVRIQWETPELPMARLARSVVEFNIENLYFIM